MNKRIDVITTSRADFGLISPVAVALNELQGVHSRLIFTGSHYAIGEEQRIAQLQAATAVPCEQVPCRGIGKEVFSSGQALADMTAGFSRLWQKEPPQLMVLLGDRYELLPAAMVAVLYGIPIAHMFGGEVDVSYCLDTQVRDAVTKMAHLHFVSHEAIRQRLMAMGEEEWRIRVAGNPAVEKLLLGREPFLDFARQQGWATDKIIAACYLPPTTQREAMLNELDALLTALADWNDHTVVWAGVNADPGGSEIQAILERHCAGNSRHHFVSGLGSQRFHSLLQCAAALVGNSSSGLLEAASYGLPVVNIGVRQTGRLSGSNVINVPGQIDEVRAALVKAIGNKDFRQRAKAQGNPFQIGQSAKLVATEIARALEMDRDKLMLKRAVQGNPQTLGGLQRVPEYSISVGGE